MSEEEIDELIKQSPYYRATSNDIDWRESVYMQGQIQKWIDHSISKTINLPKETTVETVDQLYREAYNSGCKGVTVYRDGCRDGVLISTKKKEVEDDFSYMDAVKRINPTKCDIHHISVLKDKFTVLIGILNNKPYEIFVIPTQANEVLPFDIKSGNILKLKRGSYDLVTERSGKEYRISITDLMTDEEKVSTRKYSLMLRSRIHPKYIVEQALKSGIEMVTFDKAIVRVLKKYISDGEVVTGDNCPFCGGKLSYVEGCVACKNCGKYSKCG
jgi:ribonucleoside-diphosphate reductase alpha chain